VSCAKTAEPIEMPFGVWTRVGPRKHAIGGRAHRRYLANIIVPLMCGGDAAFFDKLLWPLVYICCAYCTSFKTAAII